MNDRMKDVLRSRMIPQPVKFEFNDMPFLLGDTSHVVLAVPDGALKLASELFRKFWKCSPRVTSEAAPALADGEYRISIREDELRIDAGTESGCRYAFTTLRQLGEVERANQGRNTIFPCGEIEDRPVCGFRGIHFCIFPETTKRQILRQIRLAAYYKFNYAVIESWGVFPYQSHPEFGWADRKWSVEDFKELLSTAHDCGITLIPQFNLFGHGTLSRSGSGKHAVLDAHPELEYLYEPSGWSYCLSNPDTRKILTDLVLELHTFFESPAFFHIGCDEAHDFQTCRVCASQNPEDLLAGHLQYFHDLLAQRGTRVIMWHDMLIDRADPRWKDCIACGNERTANIWKRLPKDIVIADWQYDDPPKTNAAEEWPTTLFFQKNGFDTVICPWENAKGIMKSGEMICGHKLFGLLETTWNDLFGYQFAPLFVKSAHAAWNPLSDLMRDDIYISTLRQIHQVNQDLGGSAYEDSGHTELQIAEHFSV